MKKFEEEFDKKVDVFHVIGHHNGICCSVDEVKAFGHGWVSPEDYQNTVASNKALEKSNLRMSEENAKFVAENIELTKAIADLKSQLKKQQPEIPEITKKQAEILNDYKNGSGSLAKYLTTEIKKRDYDYFARAWVNGYTVDKEKRFYLKNKLTGQRLIRLLEENGGGFLECVTSTDEERMQFTQQEIDSMETGSYEQIEVEE